MGVGDEGYYGIGKRTGLRRTEGAEGKSERKSREGGWSARYMRAESGDRVPSLPIGSRVSSGNLLPLTSLLPPWSMKGFVDL